MNNEEQQHRYYSNRGIQLTYIGEPFEIPLVVVELAQKWYNLFKIMPDGEVLECEPDDMEVGFRDDVYNPDELQKYCDDNDMYLDIVSYELMLGRWTTLTNS